MSHLLLFPGAGAGRDQSTLVAIDRGRRAGVDDRPGRLRLPPGGSPGARPPAEAARRRPPGAGRRSTTTASSSAAARWAGGCARWSPAPPTASRRPRRWPASCAISYPLHPPGKPEQLRVEHLPGITVPCLFVHGTADPFGTPTELEHWTATIPGPVTLQFLDGGRHDLKGRDAAVVAAVREWLAELP